MVLAFFVMRYCNVSVMCFSEKPLRSVVAFEYAGTFWNTSSRKMRVSSLHLYKSLKSCSRSRSNFAQKFGENLKFKDNRSVIDRTKSIRKVSVLIGFNGVYDSNSDAIFAQESNMEVDKLDDSDLLLRCKRFTSITLGSSPIVDLYDGTESWPKSWSIFAAKWLDPDNLCETWPSLYPSFPDLSSPLLVEKISPTVSSPPPPTTKADTDLDVMESSKISEVQSQNNVAAVELFLDKPISCIPGLKRRQCVQMEECGLHTLRKLLHHFPRTYADLQNAQCGINDGQYIIFVGKILSSRGVRTSGPLSFLEVVVGCDSENELVSEDAKGEVGHQENKMIYLHLKKFFRGTRFTCQPFLRSLQAKHREGDYVCVSGKVRTMPKKDHYEMREYDLDVLEDAKVSSLCARGKPYPIYPSKKGLKPNILRDIISRLLPVLPDNVDPIPENVTRKFGLLCLHDAYVGIHQPKDLNDADLARKRLVFDEFFYLQLGRLYQMLEGLDTQNEKSHLLNKFQNPTSDVVIAEEWASLTKEFLKVLHYPLTSSQMNAVSEIIWDLKRPVPMNRLLQGDVGCGKTVVALLACMEVIGSGYQAALMVPTELLAIQHYEQLLNLVENIEEVQRKPSVALLTGSTPAKQSQIIREGLQTGDISLVIGTHSLIADKVEFLSLRIAVVDEQHRFGVIQRGRFNSKLYSTSSRSTRTTFSLDGMPNDDGHMAPHVLALSATPIPRTLALALHGDVSLTQITDLPPGRTPVETHIFEGTESGFEKSYQMMVDDLEAGGKVYIVYPVIEQSEQLPQLRAASADFETISHRFKGYNCGLLHGKMKSNEKDEALRQFRCGDTCILLSTQVIEIGVDIPDASMMVVMNAERFGIAQLHQLRGRVGRGERKSKCVLLASTASGLNRLKVLQNSSDGFHLANMDLLLRGPGNLLGKKQSGHLPEFPIARLEVDGNILQDAHLAALEILSTSSDLEQFPGLKAELSMRQPLCLLGD